jgi:serine protease
MDDTHTSRGKRGKVFWLLVLLAAVLVWLYWRAPADNGRVADLDDQAVAGDPDDILVDFGDSTSDERVAQIGQSLGIDFVLVSDESKDERFYRAHVPAERRDEILSRLAVLSDVEVAEPDSMMSLPPSEMTAVEAPVDPEWKGFPNDPQYKFQWHLDQIHMPQAWKVADGEGVIVAVIDTGVAYSDRGKFHLVPDLAGNEFVDGYDFVGNTKFAHDDHGHGTHVAGTIAQTTNNGIGVAGVAPKARIMPLKVLSASGSGSVAGIADAIRYAADKGAKVINMSLGGRFRSKVLERAVKYAHDKGVVVVCAAGNDGSGRVSYPAAYPGAVAVAATQFDEATTFYSNWGKEIDVAAPGGNTQVDQNGDGMPDGVLQNTIVVGDPTKDGYFPFMGTSMASPHVAGVAALIVGQGVTDPVAVEAILKETARTPKTGKMDKDRYGAGIVDAYAAAKKSKSERGAWQLGLGLLVAGAIAAHARKRGSIVGSTPLFLVGTLFGASGLFFIPGLSSMPVVGALAQGFPSWDLELFGPGAHGNALFFSALAPFLLITVGYGFRSLRAPLAGFAAGVAGHLAFHCFARIVDVQWVPNWFILDQTWLALNALAAGAMAYLTLRE